MHALKTRHCLGATLCVVNTLFCAAHELAVSNDVGIISDGANAAGMVAGWNSNDNCNQYAPTCNIKSTDSTVMSPDGNLILFQPPGTILTSSFPGSPIDGKSLAVPHWISEYFDRNNQLKPFARPTILSQHNDPGSFFGALSLQRRRHTSRTHPTRPEWPQQIGVGR
jgi:hypothetical protein